MRRFRGECKEGGELEERPAVEMTSCIFKRSGTVSSPVEQWFVEEKCKKDWQGYQFNAKILFNKYFITNKYFCNVIYLLFYNKVKNFILGV